MCIGLREQGAAFCLECLQSVGTGSESGRRIDLSRKIHEHRGEFGRIAALLAVHRAPGGDQRSPPITYLWDGRERQPASLLSWGAVFASRGL